MKNTMLISGIRVRTSFSSTAQWYVASLLLGLPAAAFGSWVGVQKIHSDATCWSYTFQLDGQKAELQPFTQDIVNIHYILSLLQWESLSLSLYIIIIVLYIWVYIIVIIFLLIYHDPTNPRYSSSLQAWIGALWSLQLVVLGLWSNIITSTITCLAFLL